MPAGRPLETLILHFRCPVDEATLLDIFQQVAGLMQPDLEAPDFRRIQQYPLPDRHEPRQAKVETWGRDGASIEIRIVAREGNHRQGNNYELSYRLTLDTGFRMELTGHSPDPELPELWVQLHRLWPNNFDAIHRVFCDYLGEEADATDGPRAATQNARAAIKAGHGAFARHLIDKAMDRHRARADLRLQEEEEKWWKELRRLKEEAPGD
jgi:hypothetical protein